MADNLTKAQRRRNMQAVKSTGTSPERRVMRELRKRRIYFAKNVKSIFGKPDIVFRRKKVAIFIDSDFWHCHPERFKMPKSNARYWITKIARNVERDRLVNSRLSDEGWTVIRLWDSDIKADLDASVRAILEAIDWTESATSKTT